jgi:hypothetical protein
MRLSLLCSLILFFACSAFAAGQKNATPVAPPLLIASPQQSSQVGIQPNWLPLPAQPSITSPDILLFSKPLPETPAIATEKKSVAAPAAAPAPQRKKTVRSSQRTRDNAIARNVGIGNNVPEMIAAAVVNETEPAEKPPFLWSGILARQQDGRQVTAAPPLLAGIVSLHMTAPAEEPEPQITIESVLTKKLRQQEDSAQRSSDTLDMLASLVELQKNTRQQITVIAKKLKNSTSESEKQSLQEELTKLDKQLSETGADFERIATGVESEIFSEQQKVIFSWKDELATLLEPSIKELKQLTYRARLKSDLRESINGYNKQLATARLAVEHLNQLINETKNPKIKTYLGELLPAWQNAEKRINSKLDLTLRELTQLENNNISLLESTGNSMREFFSNRGLYLLIAFVAFVAILLAFRLLARLIFFIIPGARKEQRPFHVRIMDIFFRIFSVLSAFFALIFVLYTAEDWFLLSLTFIVFVGLFWTIRQTLPKMWQQMLLVLNMGSTREGERVVYQGVPWKVETLNVFCKLYNPALGMHLRIPIEDMIGLVSRPFAGDEPWFPCKKGDWVAIDGKPFAKVVSLSHEQVEVVELGGRRTVYQTADFLAMSPANLSSNFNIRVPFGLSYNLQAEITTTVPEKLKAFLQKKLEENGYAEDCLNLSVDFLQAGSSSLDLVVLADFKGDQAPAYRRIERGLARWCVDCCNANNWEIPFPQMTVHLPSGSRA